MALYHTTNTVQQKRTSMYFLFNAIEYVHYIWTVGHKANEEEKQTQSWLLLKNILLYIRCIERLYFVYMWITTGTKIKNSRTEKMGSFSLTTRNPVCVCALDFHYTIILGFSFAFSKSMRDSRQLYQIELFSYICASYSQPNLRIFWLQPKLFLEVGLFRYFGRCFPFQFQCIEWLRKHIYFM